MMNVVKFKKEKTDQNKFANKLNSYSVLIDGEDIRKKISSAAEVQNFAWQENRNVVLSLEELHKSIEEDGEYAILTGSHCLMNGILDPLDVNLSSVRVTTWDDLVEWQLSIFHNGNSDAQLSFRFHKPQLITEVNKLPRSTRKFE